MEMHWRLQIGKQGYGSKLGSSSNRCINLKMTWTKLKRHAHSICPFTSEKNAEIQKTHEAWHEEARTYFDRFQTSTLPSRPKSHAQVCYRFWNLVFAKNSRQRFSRGRCLLPWSHWNRWQICLDKNTRNTSRYSDQRYGYSAAQLTFKPLATVNNTAVINETKTRNVKKGKKIIGKH